jgi:hypothetical protein
MDCVVVAVNRFEGTGDRRCAMARSPSEVSVHANDIRSTQATRHGAYVCLQVPADMHRAVARIDVPGLAARMALTNEFAAAGGHPSRAIAYLRRIESIAAGITDAGLFGAAAVVHVATPTSEPVAAFVAELTTLLEPACKLRILAGLVRPPSYTGNAMHNFAYAQQAVQQPGPAMPHAFIVPMCKTDAWWTKNWMEKHTYFLPRYDETGRMLAEGHALAAAAGIAFMTRRTYRCAVEPAPDNQYDFINFFECADADVTQFFEVCDALRDIKRNPEWGFVREGPTWHGRRVATWAELFE